MADALAGYKAARTPTRRLHASVVMGEQLKTRSSLIFCLPPLLEPGDLLLLRLGSSSSWAGLSRGVMEESEGPGTWRVRLDVRHFTPAEILVKVQDGLLEITGQHQERPDQHGSISRSFVRKYQLPVAVDVDLLRACLSADGVLTAEAPCGPAPRLADVIIPVQVEEEPQTSSGEGEEQPEDGRDPPPAPHHQSEEAERDGEGEEPEDGRGKSEVTTHEQLQGRGPADTSVMEPSQEPLPQQQLLLTEPRPVKE